MGQSVGKDYRIPAPVIAEERNCSPEPRAAGDWEGGWPGQADWAGISALHIPSGLFNLFTLSFLICQMSIMTTVSQIFLGLNQRTTYLNLLPQCLVPVHAQPM